jgi:threonine/homoserine/homoserine lactone efflux protein
MPSSQQLLYIVIIIGAIVLAYMTVKDLIRKPGRQKSNEETDSGNSPVLPLQLQAYERLVLLVERINPQNLITRVFQPNFMVVDMQIALVQTIKAEYEHNISQQIYVSTAAWEAVRTLKEQSIILINQIASQLPQDAPAMELNKQVLETFLQTGESPATLAARILNAEAKKIMK